MEQEKQSAAIFEIKNAHGQANTQYPHLPCTEG